MNKTAWNKETVDGGKRKKKKKNNRNSATA